MRRLALSFALALAAAAPAYADPAVDRIQACIEDKAPEGLPTDGPLRERMLKAMEGGPQACVGLVQKECEASGKDQDVCVARETNAWIAALSRSDLKGKRAAAYRKGAAAVKAQALALCEAAAAGSAWGGAKVESNGRYGFKSSDRCVRDAVAAQVLIVLVNGRGA